MGQCEGTGAGRRPAGQAAARRGALGRRRGGPIAAGSPVVLPLALAAVLLLGWPVAGRGQPTPLWAQYSPLCERNGHREYCAYTPDDDDGLPLDGDAATETDRGEREAAWLVFADHTRIRIVREEQHCRNAGETRICRAWLQASPAWSRPEPATYRGRCIPGGYRHEYSSRDLRLAYVFLFRPLV